MMKFTQITVVLFIQAIFISCSNSNNGLLRKLEKTVKNQSSLALQNKAGFSTFHLSSITDFEWDKFYVFDEYVSDKTINSITGVKWTGESVPGGNKRILFIKGKKIVDYVDFEPYSFPMFLYTCGGTEQFEFNKKDDDLLAVYERCDKNGCIYAVIPNRCVDALRDLDQKK